MKRILETLGLRSRSGVPAKPASQELHRLPWHPLFYKTLKIHIDNTTHGRRL